MKPMVSIVTIAYNADQEIERTIQSVLKQTYTDYEYVFIDGASKDNTLHIIESYREKFEALGVRYHVISEPDQGIYDAMNKGIDQATGQWIQMLNAGDCLVDETVLEDVFLNRDYTADFIYGDAVFTEIHQGISYFKMVRCLPIETIRAGMPFCHQSVFAKSDTVKKYRFQTKYKIAADYDMFARAFQGGATFEHIERVVALFDCSGVSVKRPTASVNERFQIRKEVMRISKRDFRVDILPKYRGVLREFIKMLLPGWYYAEKKGWFKRIEKVHRFPIA